MLKLIIRISNTDLDETTASPEFCRALAQLLEEKHCVMVVHGRNRELLQGVQEAVDSACSLEEQSLIMSKILDIELMAAAKLNKTFVAKLARIGIPAFGLFGADGNLVRTRQRNASNGHSHPKSGYKFEAAAVNPFWLEIIPKNGGVPVLANIALGPDGHYYSVDADQLAAVCSIAWKADALIFLTREAGVKNHDGSIIRWFEAKQLTDPLCTSTVPGNLLSKLNACHYVLQHGVKRARILPLSRSESLASFYFSKIDFGTEVILAAMERGI